MDTTVFFDRLWRDYVEIAPQARRIHELLIGRGETVANDHVAFRTFDRAPIDIRALEPLVLSLGYRRHRHYRFEAKKLRAWGYVHRDRNQPRIFLSELQTRRLSRQAQTIIDGLLPQVDADRVRSVDVFAAGRLWRTLSWAQYQTLLAESEYAAWLAMLGLRANHFTVDVNQLRHTPTLCQVLDLIKEQGITVNAAGGEIKGSPEVLLEQGSTLADRIEMQFADGDRHSVTTCYYEFAKRYRDRNGDLYDGFVAASADRLFESTDSGRS